MGKREIESFKNLGNVKQSVWLDFSQTSHRSGSICSSFNAHWKTDKPNYQSQYWTVFFCFCILKGKRINSLCNYETKIVSFQRFPQCSTDIILSENDSDYQTGIKPRFSVKFIQMRKKPTNKIHGVYEKTKIDRPVLRPIYVAETKERKKANCATRTKWATLTFLVYFDCAVDFILFHLCL